MLSSQEGAQCFGDDDSGMGWLGLDTCHLYSTDWLSWLPGTYAPPLSLSHHWLVTIGGRSLHILTQSERTFFLPLPMDVARDGLQPLGECYPWSVKMNLVLFVDSSTVFNWLKRKRSEGSGP